MSKKYYMEVTMVYKGFKFGMLLQLAVGPMCLMVFTVSSSHGLLEGLSLVLAIALVDALYIALSGFGIAAFIGRERVKFIIKLFGGFILLLFGLNLFLGSFHVSIIPQISLFQQQDGQNLFIQGLILTASNPLTILFWSGVFSAQVSDHNLTKKQLTLFGAGCVLSTLAFLSVVAVLGCTISSFLPSIIINVLNAVVGLLLILFGIRLFLKK